MSIDTPEAGRPLRRDAERNRQRIVDAAREVFAERGLRASYDDIAERAGVGVGTVYRRFPEKQELVDVLFEDRIADLLGLLDASLEMEPWAGLEHFMATGLELQADDRGFKELVFSLDDGYERIGRARADIAPRARLLVERAQEAGVVRADLDFTDLPLLQFAIGAVVDYTGDVSADVWQRVATIVLDGIRAPGATAQQVEPLAEEEFDRVMHAHASARPGGR